MCMYRHEKYEKCEGLNDIILNALDQTTSMMHNFNNNDTGCRAIVRITVPLQAL